MIQAIVKWFRDIFGPLTPEEFAICERERTRGYGNAVVYGDDDRHGTAYPGESTSSRAHRLRSEALILQAQIALAEARHHRVSHLRKALARTMGELLVAVA